MKIAYVYDAILPWEQGGIQKRVWELSRRLADEHDIHWYGLQYWDGPRIHVREGVTFHGVMEPPGDLYANRRRSISEPIAFSARLLKPLLREDFDVIDCQEFPYFPCFSSKLQSIVRSSSLVLTWHEVWGDYWYDYLGRKGWFGKAVERISARLPDVHVAVSEQTLRQVKELGVSEPRLVPNGIDVAAIEAVDTVDKPVDVLFVGRLVPAKNADLLVQAIDRLSEANPDIQCMIVGDGPERRTIERFVAENGLGGNVSVRGSLEADEDVLGLMKTADVFVLPSQREGFGITALEALACGTPVVTVQYPQNAATDLIQDGVTGRVCEASPEALGSAIIEAQSSVTASDCFTVARDYDWDHIVDRARAVYRNAA